MNRRNLIKTITGFAAAIFGTKAFSDIPVLRQRYSEDLEDWREFNSEPPYSRQYPELASDEISIPDVHPSGVTTAQAMDHLRWAMQHDPDYAYGWHANIAVAAQDNGMDWVPSQKAAATFMRNAFDVRWEEYMPEDQIEKMVEGNSNKAESRTRVGSVEHREWVDADDNRHVKVSVGELNSYSINGVNQS